MIYMFSLPYWNRSLGSDHFYICAHDMGADVAATADRNLMKNSIALVNTADYTEPYYIPHKVITRLLQAMLYRLFHPD